MALLLIPFTTTVGQVDDPSYAQQLVPNDGLTPVTSAKWGNFRGCIPADHMEQLGQRNLPDTNVQTGFDVARFYGDVANDLAMGVLMRKAFVLLAATLPTFLLVSACSDADAPAGDVCQQASDLFARCGVTLPLLSGAPCTGVVHDAAQCIAAHAANCDDLASIETKLGACASDALDSGGFVPPAEDLPVPPPRRCRHGRDR